MKPDPRSSKDAKHKPTSGARTNAKTRGHLQDLPIPTTTPRFSSARPQNISNSIDSMSVPPPAANGTADSRDPSGFLSEIIGAPVTVKLNSGVTYKGELQSVDGYMNIALEQTKEFVNGKLRRSYGDAFVRGNNGE
ncbi:U4/U6-U5 snRNP complex subunit lsm6 [Friedmanniomyces endolithicus]|uniref:U6 snRNA-associated Sm-like protein LSm6 n=1 Tax=Friedmanniomyces endolithicus TaxID=329885 RepID=A0AAN6FFT9_9PEZI|nr:U4/U6-U5 snRNP complex subunit lsm6 [Friedmanniomyces endolithicus]